MSRSIFDRIFPPPRNTPPSLLPQYQDDRRSHTPTSPSPLASSSRASSSGSPSVSRTRSRIAQTASTTSSQDRNHSILQPAPISASIIHHKDPLLPIDRASKSLERTIQSLLDAQSEGLLAGLGTEDTNPTNLEASSNGSLTPTQSMSLSSPRTANGTRTFSSPKTIPIRQPVFKKISLRSARKGLTRSLYDYAALKEEQSRILTSQLQARESAISTLHAFETKRSGLESEITKLQPTANAPENASTIRQQANDLEAEIRELEDRLQGMRNRHRYLLDEASQMENAVASKLSSWTASLELHDKEIRRYLADPPIKADLGAQKPHNDFYRLSPKRRTLTLTRQQWEAESQYLQQQISAAAFEKDALVAGARVWREVVHEVTAFEKQLRSLMTADPTPPRQSQSKSELQPNHLTNATTATAILLTSLEHALNLLASRLQTAQSNNWTLLECAIGAELEAFRAGREMLVELLGPETAENRELLGSEDGEVEMEAGNAGAEGNSYDNGNGNLVNLRDRVQNESNESLRDTLAAAAATTNLDISRSRDDERDILATSAWRHTVPSSDSEHPSGNHAFAHSSAAAAAAAVATEDMENAHDPFKTGDGDVTDESRAESVSDDYDDPDPDFLVSHS